MPEKAKRPRKNHLDLAERILGIARQRGLRPGAHLPEQQIASLCNVSRTPVRAALNLLRRQELVTWEPDNGYRLSVDLYSRLDLGFSLPSSEEETLASAIMRDRAARRLDETVTVTELMRRYKLGRSVVLNGIKSLSNDDILHRAPGQSWVFGPLLDDSASLADSCEFRLLLEPAAILIPGFKFDEVKAGILREGMEALLELPDIKFDTREFQHLDIEFHGLIAQGCANRFIANTLLSHLKLRQIPGAVANMSPFRLRQATREQFSILDNLERQQYEVAADLLRVHLRLSHSQRPEAANRGVPPLVGALGRRPS